MHSDVVKRDALYHAGDAGRYALELDFGRGLA